MAARQPRTILRVDCADEVGLIHRITGVLQANQLNIVSQGEFVDRKSHQFYLRTEFSGDFECDTLLEQLQASLPAGSVVQLREPSPKRIVVLATREYHCLGDLLLRHAYGDLQAELLAVVCNHNDLRSLVEPFEIPFHCVSHAGLSREEHEATLLSAIEPYDPEYLVLAKYMRVLTPDFVNRFPNRIINIHHSFLPAFIGARPYRQAWERGVKIIGATAHFVNENLDDGPIIAQGVMPVDHSHSPRDMARAGRDVEKNVLAKALKLVFEDRTFVCGRRTVIFD